MKKIPRGTPVHIGGFGLLLSKIVALIIVISLIVIIGIFFYVIFFNVIAVVNQSEDRGVIMFEVKYYIELIGGDVVEINVASQQLTSEQKQTYSSIPSEQLLVFFDNETKSFFWFPITQIKTIEAVILNKDDGD